MMGYIVFNGDRLIGSANESPPHPISLLVFFGVGFLAVGGNLFSDFLNIVSHFLEHN
jgi:hypothetical protein